MKKKTVWIIVLIVCSLIAIAGIVFIIHSLSLHTFSREDLTPKETTATIDESVLPDETEADSDSALEDAAAGDFGYTLADLGDFEVDFDELKSINKDIYAWIYIPNTKVDYPVVRSVSNGDDSYYLEHNIYRQYQFSGTIFSELQNNPDFHDPVTVLYGHNMLNESMFATLHKFEKQDFFAENNTAFVVTKDKIYTYLIYAAYTYDDRHILNSNFLSNSDTFMEYLDSTLHPYSLDANVREGVELNEDSRILVLSTCTNGSSNTRYLVQGVLAYEQER